MKIPAGIGHDVTDAWQPTTSPSHIGPTTEPSTVRIPTPLPPVLTIWPGNVDLVAKSWKN